MITKVGIAALLIGSCLCRVARAAEIDGHLVDFGASLTAASALADVRLRVHKIKVNDEEGVGVIGVVVSRLPTQRWKLTLTVRVWDVLPNGNLDRRGVATAVVVAPRPGKPERWQAVAWHRGVEGRLIKAVMPRQVYTVAVEAVPYSPKAEDFK